MSVHFDLVGLLTSIAALLTVAGTVVAYVLTDRTTKALISTIQNQAESNGEALTKAVDGITRMQGEFTRLIRSWQRSPD